MRQLAVSLVAASVLVSGAVVIVRAALFLEFQPGDGAPGSRVMARTSGSGATLVAGGSSLPMWFVPSGHEFPGSDAIPVGTVEIDKAGNGHTTFSVPEARPGVFDVYLHCEPCAPFSGGRTDIWVGEFVILVAPPPTDATPASRNAPWPAALAIVFLVATAVVMRFGRFVR